MLQGDFKPICIADLQKQANAILSQNTRIYIENGVYPETTLQDNREAFKR